MKDCLKGHQRRNLYLNRHHLNRLCHHLNHVNLPSKSLSKSSSSKSLSKSSSSKSLSKSSTARARKQPKPSLISNDASSSDSDQVYCICRTDVMIACDNSECAIEWYHFTCLGLNETPEGKWYCPYCEN